MSDRNKLQQFKQLTGAIAVPVIAVVFLTGLNWQRKKAARPHRKSVSYCLSVDQAKKIARNIRTHGGKVLGPFRHIKL